MMTGQSSEDGSNSSQNSSMEEFDHNFEPSTNKQILTQGKISCQDQKKGEEKLTHNLDRRMNNKAVEKEFECSRCSYKTMNWKEIRNHVLHVHPDDLRYSCSKCSFRSKFKNEYSKHLLNKHPELSDIYRCAKCEYKSLKKALLVRHERIHSTDSVLNCLKCSYTTPYSDHLKSHMLKHADVKAYKCDHCEFRTRHKAMLKQHSLRHTENEQFECPECSFKTHFKAYLKVHMNKHSDKNKLHCNECSYSTWRKDSFQQHIKRHSGLKPYECMFCGYKAFERYSLNKHFKRNSKCRQGLSKEISDKSGDVQLSDQECQRPEPKNHDLAQSTFPKTFETQTIELQPLPILYSKPVQQDNMAVKTNEKQSMPQGMTFYNQVELVYPYKQLETFDQSTDVNSVAQFSPYQVYCNQGIVASQRDWNYSYKIGENLSQSSCENENPSCHQLSGSAQMNSTCHCKSSETYFDAYNLVSVQCPCNVHGVWVDSHKSAQILNLESSVSQFPAQYLKGSDPGEVSFKVRGDQILHEVSRREQIIDNPRKDESTETIDLNSKLFDSCKVSQPLKKKRIKEVNQWNSSDFTPNIIPLREYNLEQSFLQESQNLSSSFTDPKLSFSQSQAITGAEVSKNIEINVTHVGNSMNSRNKEYECSVCKFRSFYLKDLRKHMADTHPNVRKYKCSIKGCQYTTDTEDDFSRHFFDEHDDLGDIYICSKCTYHTFKRPLMIRHEKTHDSVNLLKCLKCAYTTAYPAHLKSHAKRHQVQKPYMCDQCDFSSRHKAMLKQHMWRHSGKEPLACPHCDFKTNFKAYLKVHMERHSGGNKFHCEKCGYQTWRRDSYLAHNKRHLGVKPFNCECCGFKTLHKHNLSRHFKRHAKCVKYLNDKSTSNSEL